ncbi:MAG: YegS/Rv2252/BmrU family lipid kinase [Ruminococcus sp.]|nr:YegS/Rv2252/BmrU family lipid kinase [Ruminococcus sp.]
MKKLLFVYNPRAGKGLIRTHLCDIINIFTKGGYEVTAHPTQGRFDGMNKIARDGGMYDVIVVSGGDGTLSEAVKGMMKLGCKIPLGYIPAGSTNDFASSMDIPKNMLKAAHAIVDGITFDYDVGEFNGEYFVYVAAFGVFTDVTYETSQKWKNRLGHMAYVGEAIKRLPTYTGHKVKVEYDNGVVKGSYILALITNTKSVGGMRRLIADGVCFDDGLFEVTLVKTPSGAMDLQRLLREAALNKLSSKDFVMLRSSRLILTFEEDMAWTLDGEAGGVHRKVVIQNHKQAVSFIVRPDDKTAEQQLINALTGGTDSDPEEETDED